MSDEESTSDIESAVMYQCKKCPDKYFTAAEKDIHRQWHKNQQRQNGDDNVPAKQTRSSNAAKRKPGPKSKVKRSASPSPTLFSEVDPTPPTNNNKDDDGGGDDQGSTNEADAAAAKKKYRSTKRIRRGVVATKNEGG